MGRSARSRRTRAATTFEGALLLARNGNAEGFDALFRRSFPELVAFARARGAEDPDAIVNECLVRVFSRVAEFEGDEAGWRSWCFAICRNLLVDESRRRERRPRLADVEPDDGGMTAFADGADTAEIAVSELGAEALVSVLATLTPDQRDVIALRVIADLSIRQVAEIVGKPEGAVKALQHRALRTLSRKLSGRAVSPSRAGTLS